MNDERVGKEIPPSLKPYFVLLGRKLRKLRKGLGMNQGEVALQVRCSQSTISNAENARQAISIPLVLELAKFFEVEPSWLFSMVEMADEEIDLFIKISRLRQKDRGSYVFQSINDLLDAHLK